MAEINRDWIKKQFGKAISAEQSIIKAEKDHRDKLNDQDFGGLYGRLIRDDEKHLEDLKTVGERYGYESGGMSEGGGGILGSLKTAVESMGGSDPFQTIGDDLMMKSNAVNYDHAWTDIFTRLGDKDSAELMKAAAKEDEQHQKMMRDSLTSVGLLEARGEELEEE